MVSEYRSFDQFFEDVSKAFVLVFFALITQTMFFVVSSRIAEGAPLETSFQTFIIDNPEPFVQSLQTMCGGFLCLVALVIGLIMASPLEFLHDLSDKQGPARRVLPIKAMRAIVYSTWTVGAIVFVQTTNGNPISACLNAVCVLVLLVGVMTGIVYALWDKDGNFRLSRKGEQEPGEGKTQGDAASK